MRTSPKSRRREADSETKSFFSRWSIKFSAEYYEAKERQASGVPSLDSSGLRTPR